MRRLTRYSLLVSIATISAATAEPAVEKVIVTGSRIGSAPVDKLGTAVTILDQTQIKERQTLYVSDILRDVPGVAVNRSGGAGASTQVRMRGSEGNHTLVLFDGAELGDPFQGEFDFAGLLSGDIQRIEILRGSQSALYGSDAIGGVINIIPRRGQGDGSFEAVAEGGSFAGALAGINFGYGDDAFDIFASTSRHTTSGTNNSHFGAELDGARETSWFINTGLHPAANLELRALLRYVETYAEGDPQDFDFLSPTQGFVIDGNETTTTKSLVGQIQAKLSSWNDKLQTRLSYAFNDAGRHNYSGGAPSFFSQGDRNGVSLVSRLNFDTTTARHSLTGAIDWKRETYQNLPLAAPTPINDRRDLESSGVVASYDVSIGDFDAGAALRRDRNNEFQPATTYRLQASYSFDQTRLRATAGSGIKNPTNFELFGFDPGSFIGNPGLKPEKSVGWDIGIDQYLWNKRTKITATWFQATLEDEVFTDFLPGFISTPGNRTDRSHRSGVELTFDADIENWSLAAAYTYLHATEGGLEEVRRPPHIASLNLTYHFLDTGSLTLTARYNGKQQDNEFIFATPTDFVTLKPYTLVNLNMSYGLTDHVELYGRVDNLLDEKYEEVFSFSSPGIAAYAGIRVKI